MHADTKETFLFRRSRITTATATAAATATTMTKKINNLNNMPKELFAQCLPFVIIIITKWLGLIDLNFATADSVYQQLVPY